MRLIVPLLSRQRSKLQQRDVSDIGIFPPIVFLSHASKDKPYVEELDAALTKEGVGTWIDKSKLHPGQSLTPEIQRGIETAHALIFIISPDSVVSYWCNLELAHAVANNIPILPVGAYAEMKSHIETCLDEIPIGQLINGIPLKEVATSHWKECLSQIKWIEINATDSVDKTAKEIFDILRTDFAYLDEHTRFRVLARQWEHHHKHNGFTLPEGEISPGLNFLKRGEVQTGAPHPTLIQKEFIIASQRYRAWLRRLRLSLLIALVVTAIVAFVFLLVRQRTEFDKLSQNTAFSLGLPTPGNWRAAALEACNALSLNPTVYKLDPTEATFSVDDCPSTAGLFVGEDWINLMRFQLGRACLKLDNYICAEEAFREILKNPVFPPNSEYTMNNVLNNLTLALIGSKNFREAKETIAKFDSNANKFSIIRLEGKLAYEMGNFDDALMILEPFWQKMEEPFPAYREEISFELAMIYHMQGDCTRASMYWEDFWTATNFEHGINWGELDRREEAQTYQNECQPK